MLGNFAHLLFGARRLDEGDIGAGFDIGLRALDRVLEAVHGNGVGAGHDGEVAIVAGVHRGVNFLHHLGRGG